MLFALCACARGPGAASDKRLVDVERQLTRTFTNKGIKVSLPAPDTLFVHVPIGRDIVRFGPRALTNLDSASRVVARSALAATDSSGTAQLTVVVELSRSRQLGPFVWSAGSKRTTYASSELRSQAATPVVSSPLP
ncbi:MAG: hypothetical protein HOQ09_00395 [Gemmatimonadaceae bacterium]|nr:hypothetical protein [Gemmatimonadaceae bacterium]